MAKKRKIKVSGDWVAITAFFFVLLFILALFDYLNIQQRTELIKEKEKLLQTITTNDLTKSDFAFIIGDTVDKSRLTGFASKPYSEIKTQLGMKSDFVLFFSDGNNTIVPIADKVCIGSPKAKVGGVSCG